MAEPSLDLPPFDLVVLGAGSGGLAGAKRAALRGARVLVIEASRIGGTCVLRGCIPKKLMFYASLLGETRALSAAYGWAEAQGRHSWPELCAARDAVLERLEAGHTAQLAKAHVTVMAGEARFLDAHTVAVAGQRILGRHFLVATGGAALMPAISGIEHCIDSDGFFQLPQRPASAVIVGGGYIAVEFAGLLQSLGCQVQLVVRSSLLRPFDKTLATHVRVNMQRLGVEICEHTDVLGVQPPKDGTTAVSIRGSDGQQSQLKAACCVLFAVGRQPRTQVLGCAAAGISLDAQGAIQVDPAHRTSQPHIFAVGDVINRVNLTPVAIKAARGVAEGLFGTAMPDLSYDGIPTAVFSHPPIGTVGLTQAEAEANSDYDVAIYESRFVPLMYAVQPAERKVQSVIKLVVDAKTDRILGFHMAGDDAPEIIQGFAAALQAGITKSQLDATVALHPTAAEEFVLLR